MKHEHYQLVLFGGFGFLFLWLDILIGHVGSGLRNIFMWIPLVTLPVAMVISVMTAFRATKFNRKIFYVVYYLVIFVGMAGFCFHLLRFVGDLHGQIQWEVLVRLMRYPPLLAPLSVSGLGVLGLLVNRQKP